MPPVAFTTVLAAGITQVFRGDPLPFSVVITNLGNHFDPANFVFTCPYSGYYEFFLSATVDVHEYSEFTVMNQRGEKLLQITAHGFGRVNSDANQVIAHCSAGDVIWVESPADVYLARGNSTTFSAELITNGNDK